jgi:hypothetical protein
MTVNLDNTGFFDRDYEDESNRNNLVLINENYIEDRIKPVGFMCLRCGYITYYRMWDTLWCAKCEGFKMCHHSKHIFDANGRKI